MKVKVVARFTIPHTALYTMDGIVIDFDDIEPDKITEKIIRDQLQEMLYGGEIDPVRDGILYQDDIGSGLDDPEVDGVDSFELLTEPLYVDPNQISLFERAIDVN